MKVRDISIPQLHHVHALRSLPEEQTDTMLIEHRDYAQTVYESLPAPSRKDPAWRHVPLPTIPWDELLLREMHIDRIELGGGAFACDIRDFIRNYPALAQRYIFAKGNKCWEKRTFSAVVEMSWNKGLVIFVPTSATIENVIDIGSLMQYHDPLLVEKIVVIVQDGARVTLRDSLCSSVTVSHYVIRSVDYFIEPYAHVSVIHDQNWSSEVCEVSRTSFYLKQESSLEYSSVLTGGLVTKTWLDVILQGPKARASINGVYALQEKQSVSVTTNQNHLVADSVSDLTIHGIINDRAQAVYQGNIFVSPEGTNTQASQSNKNLLLSDTAQAWSIPGLEVLTNEVQCAHGSAIGQLDAEHLFYMQSRGIPEKQAKSLLLQGFFAQNLQLIYDKTIKNQLRDRIINNAQVI